MTDQKTKEEEIRIKDKIRGELNFTVLEPDETVAGKLIDGEWLSN
jgi:hypothetical protein